MVKDGSAYREEGGDASVRGELFLSRARGRGGVEIWPGGRGAQGEEGGPAGPMGQLRNPKGGLGEGGVLPGQQRRRTMTTCYMLLLLFSSCCIISMIIISISIMFIGLRVGVGLGKGRPPRRRFARLGTPDWRATPLSGAMRSRLRLRSWRPPNLEAGSTAKVAARPRCAMRVTFLVRRCLS